MNVSVLFVALTLGAPGAKEALQKSEAIVGDWEVQSLTIGGEIVPFSKTRGDRVVLRFDADGKVTWPDEDGKDRGEANQTYKLDTSVPLARIDWMNDPPGKPHSKAVGIFKIEGDVLTLALTGSSSDRPAAFGSSKLDSTRVWVLKRVKKKE